MTTTPFLDALMDGSSPAKLDFRGDSHRIGSVYEMNYQRAVVAIYDHDREAAGGLPMGGFLVAAKQDGNHDFILLRILREARLPNAQDSSQTRQHAIEAAANEQAWAHQLDDWTRDRLSIHGVECRVLGTFIQKPDGSYRYAEDVDNYYAVNQLLVWKPGASTLSMIVNYRHNSNPIPPTENPPTVGATRFAASQHESAIAADVVLYPEDMLRRRTVYLGMSRSGKSNAMKIAAEAIYRMREHDPTRRIGQLIFDPNGEYAQDNPQDGAGLHRIHEVIGRDRTDEVETYGLFRPPTDPDRTITKINFFGNPLPARWSREEAEVALEQLLVGRQIIQGELAGADSRYIRAFRDADLSVPDIEEADRGPVTRYRRVILAYQTALFSAGLGPPTWQPSAAGVIGDEILTAMQKSGDDNIAAAAKRLRENKQQPSWDVLRRFFTELNRFISDEKGPYRKFNDDYMEKPEGSGESWAEARFADTLRIFFSQNGPRSFQRVRTQHDENSANDYAECIVNDLREGKLVIVDQSTGDPEQNAAAAERIMWKIFNRQQEAFRVAVEGAGERDKHHILVYLEEAHNLLPRANASENLTTVWARSAKEGSKLDIGMVLATQAPSSIMSEILSETDNWILAHLNSKKERTVLGDYEDFDDFLDQIGQVSEPGFVRMRSLSLAYTVPVQFRLFRLDLEPRSGSDTATE
ncbi:MAG: DUF87 domain-containing protein [Chloroflexi bacterium]|nr:DUF87 domain-containing protein [Chloroflexota bacterium]